MTKAEKAELFKTKLREKLRTYKTHPFSLIMMILVTLACAVTIFLFIALVGYVCVKGIPYLKPSLFALNYTTENVSMLPSIITTVEMVGITLLIAVPLGVFCEIYLCEYAKRGNKLVKIIRLATETLSGIPSIIYGLFGMLFFVTAIKWGYSILAGSFTLAIMVLPTIIRSTEEALLAVDDSYREGSFGLGAGKLRTVFVIVLPSAASGILSGIILSIGRIVGETAALIYTAGTVAKIPESVLDSARTMSIHMYSLSREGLHMGEASATAVILLVTVLLLNTIAEMIARRFAARQGA